MTTTTLSGRKVTILGGTSGFGLAVAKAAAAEGAELFLGGRDAAKLARVLADFQGAGVTAAGQALNAADPASLAAFLETMGETDHFVSMAGGAMGGGFLANSVEAVRHAIEEKFFVNLAIAKAAVPYLRAGGSLVFTAGSGGRPDNASGAIVGNDAIGSLVRGLALETAPRLRVNAVAPTWTVTPLWRAVGAEDLEATRAHMASVIPLGRTAEPEEVAQAYLFAMSCGFLTGQVLRVDGGISLL